LKYEVISSFSFGPQVFFLRSRDNKCIVRRVGKRVAEKGQKSINL
jgi:hypothetical protein